MMIFCGTEPICVYLSITRRENISRENNYSFLCTCTIKRGLNFFVGLHADITYINRVIIFYYDTILESKQKKNIVYIMYTNTYIREQSRREVLMTSICSDTGFVKFSIKTGSDC